MSFQLTEDFSLMHCANCGVAFAMTVDYEKRRRADHARFYCPTGHGNSFNGETETERLERRLKCAEESRDRASERADRERRRNIAARGQITKLRKKLNPPTDDQEANA